MIFVLWCLGPHLERLSGPEWFQSCWLQSYGDLFPLMSGMTQWLASAGLLTSGPTHGFSMWLGLLTEWGLGCSESIPKGLFQRASSPKAQGRKRKAASDHLREVPVILWLCLMFGKVSPSHLINRVRCVSGNRKFTPTEAQCSSGKLHLTSSFPGATF